MKVIKYFRSRQTGRRFFFIRDMDKHSKLINLLFSAGENVKPVGLYDDMLRVIIEPKDFDSFEQNLSIVGYGWELDEREFTGLSASEWEDED